MNVLVVSSWWPYPPDNGSRLRAWNLIRELSRRHRITLLAFGRTGAIEEDRRPLEGLCDEVHLAARPPQHGDRLGMRGLWSRVPRYFVQSENAAMRTLVSRFWRRHDLALALQIEAALYLADRPGLPRVFDEVEVTVPRDRVVSAPTALRRVRHRLTWFKHRRFVRDLVNRFDAATVVSAPERAAVEAIGVDASRVSVVPNGIWIREDPVPDRRAERVIYPGSVMYDANLDAVRYFVRDIFPVLRRLRPDLQFWVTGEVGRADLTDLRAPGVVFTGYVDDIETLIAQSAVCVVPLRIGGGTRLKVLQAMAVGTPVVSTAKGVEGLELVPQDHVLLADTTGAFADRVLHLLAAPAAGVALARRARTFVEERYAWPAIGEALEGVIRDAHARFSARGSAGPRRAWAGHGAVAGRS